MVPVREITARCRGQTIVQGTEVLDQPGTCLRCHCIVASFAGGLLASPDRVANRTPTEDAQQWPKTESLSRPPKSREHRGVRDATELRGFDLLIHTQQTADGLVVGSIVPIQVLLKEYMHAISRPVGPKDIELIGVCTASQQIR